MKRLQRYYYLVGTPVFLLVLGAVFFFPEIARTVYSNPHPQINYAIFALMAGGCGLMLVHIRRINREGLLLGEFVAVMKSNDSEKLKTARTWLEKIKQSKRSDISDVLELVLDHFGKPLGAVQHAALESEIAHFQAQQQRRLLLAQFLSGMMVGLGLFGTFIGLLGALEEIGKLIGSFSIGPGASDPGSAVTDLVARLTSPMKAMGVAFSASLFGVLGSLIMGMLMVFVKGASAELISMLQSRVSWLTDLGTNEQGVSLQPMQEALAQLAEHSPLLQGLTVALDQSERKVRQLLSGMHELAGQVQQGAQMQTQLLDVLQQQNQLQMRNAQQLESLQAEQVLTRTTQERAEQRHEQGLQILSQLSALVGESLSRQEPVRDALLQLQQNYSQQSHAQNALWQEALKVTQQQLQQYTQQLQQSNSQQIQAQNALWQESLQQTQQHQQQQWQTQVQQQAQQLLQAQQEREQWVSQLQSWQHQQEQVQYRLLERLLTQEQASAQERTQWQQMQEHLLQEQKTVQGPLRTLAELMQQAHAQWRSDHQLRSEQLQQTRAWVEAQQAQHEQLLHALLRAKDPAAGT